MRWSEDKLLEYQARTKTCKYNTTSDEEGKECELDAKIAKYCKEHGYYAFHDYSRGKNKSGHLDWVIALPNGRTVWIENKSKMGKLSDAQKLNMVLLSGLGHEVYECRSFKRFLEIINGKSD